MYRPDLPAPASVTGSVVQAETGGLARWDWPTLGLLAACLGALVFALSLPGTAVLISLPLLVLALVLHSSLSHEILHGHPFRHQPLNCALAMVQPGLLIPYLRFRRLHLAHHRDANLTDPYDDPETNYLDPVVWARLSPMCQRLLQFNNTLLGRMLVGPAIGYWTFLRSDLAMIRKGDLSVARDWLMHVPGALLVIWVVSLSPMSVWIYLLGCYGALSVLKIRTFLEHRAHERASGRSVIIEDRGLLALLFLNNNLHAVHHKHPNVAWYRLPRLYRDGRARFLARNQGYVYRSYGEVFARHFLRGKDPVAHPLWRGE